MSNSQNFENPFFYEIKSKNIDFSGLICRTAQSLQKNEIFFLRATPGLPEIGHFWKFRQSWS